MDESYKLIDKFTIIPTVRKLKDFDDALKSVSKVVFLSDVHIGNLEILVKKCHEHKKMVLVNTDLIGGFNADIIGVKLLKDLFKVDGIIASNSMVINLSKSIGLYTIQRFFLIDSRGVDSGLKILKTSKSDAIEILPGLICTEFRDQIRQVSDAPLIGAGFIKEKPTIYNIYKNGFMGVTTSKKDLWNDYSYLK